MERISKISRSVLGKIIERATGVDIEKRVGNKSIPVKKNPDIKKEAFGFARGRDQ